MANLTSLAYSSRFIATRTTPQLIFGSQELIIKMAYPTFSIGPSSDDMLKLLELTLRSFHLCYSASTI